MKTVLGASAATLVAALLGIASTASAAEIPLPAERPASSVETVQFGSSWRSRAESGYAQRFDRRDERNYYNGYRGRHVHRPGFRRHNGFWFPEEAFVAGALITGAINATRDHVDDHVAWCSSRYRSYRVSNDTWQPNYGPRRTCVSPYD